MKDLKYRHWVDGSIIAIEDLHGTDSVTVNVEVVLAEVEKSVGSLASKFVIWRDKEGIWDGLMYRDGRVLIYPIGIIHFEEAKQKLLELGVGQSVDYQFDSDPVGDT